MTTGPACPQERRPGAQSPLTLTIWRSVWPHLDQVGRVRHHLVDRLVGVGVLVEERVRVPPRDAGHPRVEVLPREQPARRRPGVVPAGAVRRGHQRRHVPLADDDVGRRPHRARDQAPLPLARGDRALARQPHLAPEVRLPLGVVVMAVDRLGRARLGAPRNRPELVDDAVHHLLAVEVGEPLRPPQRLDVARRTPARPRPGRPGRGRAAGCADAGTAPARP